MTVSRSQPKMDELMTELRRHQAEYAELVHGPLCGLAADRIEELEGALRDTLCELTACAVQLAARGLKGHKGDSVSRAQTRARAALQPKAGS